MGHVDPDLVGSSRLKPALDQGGGGAEGFEHRVVGDSRFPVPADDGHFLPVGWAAANVAFDPTLRGPGEAGDQGVIPPFHGVGGELDHKAVMRLLRLRDDQKAAGVFVDPVHDPRPFHAADAGKLVPAVGQERVDQGSVRIAGCRVDHQTGRLIDDEQVGVLEDDVEPDRLGLRDGVLGGGMVRV